MIYYNQYSLKQGARILKWEVPSRIWFFKIVTICIFSSLGSLNWQLLDGNIQRQKTGPFKFSLNDTSGAIMETRSHWLVNAVPAILNWVYFRLHFQFLCCIILNIVIRVCFPKLCYIDLLYQNPTGIHTYKVIFTSTWTQPWHFTSTNVLYPGKP